MASRPDPADNIKPAGLIVINPSGGRTRAPVAPMPFGIGRAAENQLVLRDNRVSRNHARIVLDGGDYVLEDLKSSHGVQVNGTPVQRQALRDNDRIEFGVPDSYTLVFTFESDEIKRILGQLTSTQAVPAISSDLGKLKALVEVARALQNSLSPDDVLASVVDAALTVTGLERGFLLLNKAGQLRVSVARNREGASIPKDELRVSMAAIQIALEGRRDLLSMAFDPAGDAFRSNASTASLDVRSVICVPLVHVRTGSGQETIMVSAKNSTTGLIYLDSSQLPVELSSGSSELLQTLALEASTVLENARLLEEERVKRRMEEELNIAREIQLGLLPKKLPSTGWLRVAGWSLPSHQVGGDYYDVQHLRSDCWSVVVMDVSGKGVSSALLGALLQGTFLLAAEGALEMEKLMGRVNRYLIERTEGEKYATVFFCTVDSSGLLRWTNAGHCNPFVLKPSGELRSLATTGMPLGMLEAAQFGIEELQLEPGDKLVAYTDGLTEAESDRSEFYETARLKRLLTANPQLSCAALLATLISDLNQFTGGAEQSDDITAVVFEYCPA